MIEEEEKRIKELLAASLDKSKENKEDSSIKEEIKTNKKLLKTTEKKLKSLHKND